jgi:uncharacterized protein
MLQNLTFSRFTHSFTRSGVTAVFHSLKMKPIFLEEALYKHLREAIGTQAHASRESFSEAYADVDLPAVIEALKEIRVLNEHEGRDDEVIGHFQRGVGMAQTRIAYFILAESCNLCCKYCFERAPQARESGGLLMTEEVALSAIAFWERTQELGQGQPDHVATEDSERDLIFYGGEPLLNYPVLRRVMEEVKSRQAQGPRFWREVKASVVTNGTLLTTEIASELHRLGVSIGISIDGPGDITDSNRLTSDGGSAFGRISQGIEACKEAGVGFGLSVTLSDEVVSNFRRVIDFIKQTGPMSLGFNILMGGPKERADEYNEKAAQFLIDAFCEFREDGLYEDRMMRKVNTFVKSEVYPFDCGACGGNQLVFAPSGQVGICHGYLQDKRYFPTTVADRDFDPSLDGVFQEWAKRTPLNMSECQDCPALGICGGGCPMNADKNRGSIWALDERFCVHAKKTLEWLVWDLYSKATAS